MQGGDEAAFRMGPSPVQHPIPSCGAQNFAWAHSQVAQGGDRAAVRMGPSSVRHPFHSHNSHCALGHTPRWRKEGLWLLSEW
eukprot:scaffold73789_cov21-Tisochrysis_lutea.AAC.1